MTGVRRSAAAAWWGAVVLTLVSGTAMADAGSTYAAAGGLAGYPTPHQAGFHHAALLYHDAVRDDAELKRYVAYRPDGVTLEPGGWLFDAFVELGFTAPSGQSTDYGKTNAADWVAMLDWWFGDGTRPGELTRVDRAIVQTAAEITSNGRPMGNPPGKRKVMIMIPRPDPAVTNFGVVDGRQLDMSNPRHRAQAVGWYTQLIKDRFAAKGFAHLELWGAYFMREDITRVDEQWMRDATAQVRAKGVKSLWIPYWSAPNWNRHRDFGIDVAILQPGAAFRGPIDGGTASGSRIRSAAKQAEAFGLGVEIEARSGGHETPAEHRVYLQYLAEGGRSGYQSAVSAWFVGLGQTPFNPGAPNYGATAEYIRGRPVRDDDLRKLNWSWRNTAGGRQATATFPARDDLSAVRVEFDEPTESWFGKVTVQAQVAGAWQAGGWAWRTTAQPLDGRWQSLTVPLARKSDVTGLRINFENQPGVSDAPNVTALIADTAWPTGNANIATGKPYRTVTTSGFPAKHGDTSGATTTGFGTGKLNDGHWSNNGWNSDRQIGWFSVPGSLKLTFDLGTRRPIDRIRLRAHGGTDNGVNWPLEAGALLTDTCVPPETAGRGARPCEGRYAPARPPAITGGSGTTDQSGYLTLLPAPGSTARWATITAQTNGWIMLDEVEIISNGINIARSANYHLSHVPTPIANPDTEDDNYLDDGVRLTDGRIAPALSWRTSSGWSRGHGETATVDLGKVTSVRTATAWFTLKAQWGVERPASVTVEASTNGTTWSTLGRATTGTMAPSLTEAIAYRVIAGDPVRARWIRYVVSKANAAVPGGDSPWVMLNELEVT